MRYVAVTSLILALTAEAVIAQDEPQKPSSKEALSDSIAYLLRFVEESEAVFIRNGQEHDAKKASQHMQRKYRHFRDKIHTAEDFIRLAGTKSMMSGKPYMVRLKNGKEMACSEWLSEALGVYRRTVPESDKKSD